MNRYDVVALLGILLVFFGGMGTSEGTWLGPVLASAGTFLICFFTRGYNWFLVFWRSVVG